ncbi:MAG: CHASE2 domain-containing protein [Thermodesulfobacteriota bacterium]
MLKKIWHISGFKIALFSTLGILIIFYLDPDFFSLLELKTLDLRFLTRGQVATSEKIVLVTIDEKSLAELGRWPWPRSVMARLLDTLAQYETKVIGLDLVWAEPDQNSELRVWRTILQKMKDWSIKNQEVEKYLSQALASADTDQMLANSVANSRRAILGYFFHFGPQESTLSEKTVEEVKFLSAYNLVRYSSAAAQKAYVFEAEEAEINIPIISAAAQGAGFFNIFPDRDGTVRWAPLVVKYKGKYFCPLSLAVLQKYLGGPPLVLQLAEFGVDNVTLGDIPIPANEEGRLLINYCGPPKTFPHYSATDVLHGRISAEKFRDKIVLVGATAIGIYDMRVTPFSQVFPGLEIHANVMETILKQKFLYRPNWVAIFDILNIILIGIILGLILPKAKATWGVITAVSFLLLFPLIAYYLFKYEGIWINVVYPLGNIILTYLALTVHRYLTEEKEKKKIRGAFQYYLSPPVVEQMLRNPERLKLGGEKKELTVLFSDIRGFTSFSEQMAPENLVKFLNEYLSKMTEIVFKYDGLLDKYMGDAIMAIWGAPLEQPDHPLRACYTALDMVGELSILREKWRNQGMPALNIGVGINTGLMVVGNMGSEKRFDYTVMGDSVNLGSRLEGLNKLYGTSIIVSEFTYSLVKEEILGRELDLVRVKGKDQPVRIYELLARFPVATPAQRELAQEFQAALVAYHNRQWLKAETIWKDILQKFAADEPSKLYIERCQMLMKNPPPPDWDGVYSIITK